MKSPYGDVQISALETLARFPNDQTIGVLTKLLDALDTSWSAFGAAYDTARTRDGGKGKG